MKYSLQEDILGSDRLPGYSKVEALAETLTKVALEEGHKLTVKADVVQTIVEQWGQVDDHDKDWAKFLMQYEARWRTIL